MVKYLDVLPIVNGQGNAVLCTECGAFICPQYQDTHDSKMHPRDVAAGWKEPVVTRSVNPFADRALDAVVAWLNDPRLHSDPGTLEDMYDAIRQTGRRIRTDPLACCSHDDDWKGRYAKGTEIAYTSFAGNGWSPGIVVRYADDSEQDDPANPRVYIQPFSGGKAFPISESQLRHRLK